MRTPRRTTSAAAPSRSRPHWYRDLSIRTRIFGLTAVLLLGLVASTVTGIVNGSGPATCTPSPRPRSRVQQQVEAARYNLLWAANWQNITAWRARVDGGACRRRGRRQRQGLPGRRDGLRGAVHDRPQPARREGAGRASTPSRRTGR